MQEYRDYYRSAPTARAGGVNPALRWTIVILSAIYVAGWILVTRVATPQASFVYQMAKLVPEDFFAQHRYWQIVTYIFVHDLQDPFHLVLNMFILWVAGRELEPRVGTWRFVRFLGVATLLGSSIALVVALPFRDELGTHAIFGSSAPCFAVLAAYAVRSSRQRMPLFLLIEVPALVGVLFLAVIDILLTIQSGQSALVVLASHAGVAIFGVIFARAGERRPVARVTVQRARAPSSPAASASLEDTRRETESGTDLEDAMDRVLRKVHEQGMERLTPAEKQVLERASQHFRARQTSGTAKGPRSGVGSDGREGIE